MAGKNGRNQELTQANNREQVLKALQHNRVCSRATLARSVGLKQATITNIINDFIGCGLVEEQCLMSGSKGRRAIGVSITENNFRVIGFRLTRKYFTVGVFSLNCVEVREPVRVELTTTAPVDIIEKACQIINDTIASSKDEVFLAVGVSLPGPYYRDAGEIALISAFPGWQEIKINDMMESRINIPVVIEHDANAGALAECVLTPERSIFDTVVYVSVGQGIGAGIIENGDIYHGAQGIAGEIGHTCIDVDGPLCDCGGRGCLTQYASTLALAENISKRMKFDECKLSTRQAIMMVKEGVPEAVEAFHEIMKYLSIGIRNLIFSYNPDLIIIGDTFSEIGESILEEINKSLECMTVRRLTDQISIELSKLGSDSAYVGSAVVATQYIFKNVDRLMQ